MPVERRGQVIALKSGQPATGGTRYSTGRRQPSRGGTSRMTRECQVRICERLGVQFPGPTRQFPGPTRPARKTNPAPRWWRGAMPGQGLPRRLPTVAPLRLAHRASWFCRPNTANWRDEGNLSAALADLVDGAVDYLRGVGGDGIRARQEQKG